MKRKFFILSLLFLLLAACTDGGQGVDVLYRDQFVVGETGQWIVEGDSKGRTAVVDERLIIQIDEPGTMQFTTLQDPLFSDFDLSVNARIVAGDSRSSYGVLFRMQDLNQFYRFEVTGAGLYIIERRDATGSWYRLIEDWTPSAAINQGVGSVNQLRIVAAGSKLSFYVNGILMREVQDSTFRAGAIALDAGTFGQGGLQVSFDDLVVTAVSP